VRLDDLERLLDAEAAHRGHVIAAFDDDNNVTNAIRNETNMMPYRRGCTSDKSCPSSSRERSARVAAQQRICVGVCENLLLHYQKMTSLEILCPLPTLSIFKNTYFETKPIQTFSTAFEREQFWSFVLPHLGHAVRNQIGIGRDDRCNAFRRSEIRQLCIGFVRSNDVFNVALSQHLHRSQVRKHTKTAFIDGPK
jgi:hypothetical protein